MTWLPKMQSRRQTPAEFLKGNHAGVVRSSPNAISYISMTVFDGPNSVGAAIAFELERAIPEHSNSRILSQILIGLAPKNSAQLSTFRECLCFGDRGDAVSSDSAQLRCESRGFIQEVALPSDAPICSSLRDGGFERCMN
jgi:hypothetical protein